MTARFVFRLEPVLELRERREELAQGELARAIAAAAAQQEAAVAADGEVAARLEELRRLQGGVVQLHALRTAHDGLQHARRVAEHEHETTRRLDGVAAERQAELVRASQDREALARLKRRQHDAHEREGRRQEGLALDEIGLRRHAASRAVAAVGVRATSVAAVGVRATSVAAVGVRATSGAAVGARPASEATA